MELWEAFKAVLTWLDRPRDQADPDESDPPEPTKAEIAADQADAWYHRVADEEPWRLKAGLY